MDGKSKGISSITLSAKGDHSNAKEKYLVEDIANPSYICLSPNRKYMYAVAEVGPEIDIEGGRVNAYHVERNGEEVKLKLVNSESTLGHSPCHVTTNTNGTMVAVANYAGSNVCVYPVREDGGLDSPSHIIRFDGTGPNKARQEKAHPHSCNFSTDGKYLYVPDLGADRIWSVPLEHHESKYIEAKSGLSALGGSGPRLMVIHPNGLAYVLNELSCTLAVYKLLPKGELTEVQEISALPATMTDEQKANYLAADLHLHPNNKWLYYSIRGFDKIAVFHIDEDGRATLTTHVPAGGECPRGILIMPGGQQIVVASQNSDKVIGFNVCQENGTLSKEWEAHAMTPVCLQFLSHE